MSENVDMPQWQKDWEEFQKNSTISNEDIEELFGFLSPEAGSEDPTAAQTAVVSSDDPTAAQTAVVPSGDSTATQTSAVPSGDPTVTPVTMVSSGCSAAARTVTAPSGHSTSAHIAMAPSGDSAAALTTVLPSGDSAAACTVTVPSGHPTVAHTAMAPSGDSAAAHTAMMPPGHPTTAQTAMGPPGHSAAAYTVNAPSGHFRTAHTATAPSGHFTNARSAVAPSGHSTAAQTAMVPAGHSTAVGIAVTSSGDSSPSPARNFNLGTNGIAPSANGYNHGIGTTAVNPGSAVSNQHSSGTYSTATPYRMLQDQLVAAQTELAAVCHNVNVTAMQYNSMRERQEQELTDLKADIARKDARIQKLRSIIHVTIDTSDKEDGTTSESEPDMPARKVRRISSGNRSRKPQSPKKKNGNRKMVAGGGAELARIASEFKTRIAPKTSAYPRPPMSNENPSAATNSKHNHNSDEVIYMGANPASANNGANLIQNPHRPRGTPYNNLNHRAVTNYYGGPTTTNTQVHEAHETASHFSSYPGTPKAISVSTGGVYAFDHRINSGNRPHSNDTASNSGIPMNKKANGVGPPIAQDSPNHGGFAAPPLSNDVAHFNATAQVVPNNGAYCPPGYVPADGTYRGSVSGRTYPGPNQPGASASGEGEGTNYKEDDPTNPDSYSLDVPHQIKDYPSRTLQECFARPGNPLWRTLTVWEAWAVFREFSRYDGHQAMRDISERVRREFGCRLPGDYMPVHKDRVVPDLPRTVNALLLLAWTIRMKEIIRAEGDPRPEHDRKVQAEQDALKAAEKAAREAARHGF